MIPPFMVEWAIKIGAVLAVVLAIWWGIHYVQGLQETVENQKQVIAQKELVIGSLTESQKALKQKAQIEEDAHKKWEAAYVASRNEFIKYQKRHAVSLAEIARVNPIKAQTMILDEYNYRITCIELLTGRPMTEEEKNDPKLKQFCEVK